MKPRIFIGSSNEAKPFAGALLLHLNDVALPTVWDQSGNLSLHTLDNLLHDFARKYDFGVFVFSIEDVVKMRGVDYEVARDNVVLEAALFMGMHGKDRAFIVMPERRPNFHVPSDFLGLTAALYDVNVEPRTAMGAASWKIKQAMNNSVWTTQRVTITSEAKPKAGKTYPLKMRFQLTNTHSTPVLVESISFDLNPSLRLAPNAQRTLILAPNKYRPQFLVRQELVGPKTPDCEQKDIYEERCVIEPRNSRAVVAWVPLHTDDEAALVDAVKTKTVGVWKYRCCWMGDRVITCEYEENF